MRCQKGYNNVNRAVPQVWQLFKALSEMAADNASLLTGKQDEN